MNITLQLAKPLFILSFLIFNVNSLSSQSESDIDETWEELWDIRNEIKVNLSFIPFGYIELAYERILPLDNSIGFVVGKSFRDFIETDTHCLAYYRMYFGDIPSSGFFIEANGAYWNEKERWRNEHNYGFGFAIGAKFVKYSGLHGEFVVGVGRALTEDATVYDEAYPRLGILMGYRF